MNPEDHYHLLSEDDNHDQPPPKTGRLLYRSPNRPLCIFMGCIVLLTISILSYTILSTRVHEPHQVWRDCGGSPDEARSRGCKFDLLSFAWQTSECYDHDLHEQFLAYEEWQFFTAKLGNETVPLEVARMGDRTLYATETYHFVHCTFMWMQMHRAYTILGYIDSHLDAYNHTLHCQGVLFKRGSPPSQVTTVGVLKYPSCRRIF
jgi:hypothetical protein